jgi:hypothetical protein
MPRLLFAFVLNPQTDGGVTYVSEILKKFNRVSLLSYLLQAALRVTVSSLVAGKELIPAPA